jgi:hypothetical protein
MLAEAADWSVATAGSPHVALFQPNFGLESFELWKKSPELWPRQTQVSEAAAANGSSTLEERSFSEEVVA